MLLFVGGFVAVSGIAIRGYATTRGVNGGGIYDGTNTFSLSTNTLVLFIFCLALALALSLGYMWIARLFPKQLIWITVILNIISAFVTGIYMISRGGLGGIMFLVFGVFLIFMYWTWRSRVPFSALMLSISIDIAKGFGHVYLVSLLGGIVAVAFGAWYAVTVVAIFTRWSPGSNPACSTLGDCSDAKVTGLIVYVTFTMYWLSEWLKNTIHTTISGVYGSWYYNSRNYPKKVTRGALRRSLTYSFGSISLGSLFVAIINFIRQLCSVAYQSQAGEGGFVGMCIYCFVQCILGFIKWAVEFVNRYAFSYIALFGKAYFPAAKETWRMIKDRGIDALINVSQPRGEVTLRCIYLAILLTRLPELSCGPRPYLRCPLCRVHLLASLVSLPRLHEARVQHQRGMDRRHHTLLVHHRASDRACFHNPDLERRGHDFCGSSVGPRRSNEGSPRYLWCYGQGLSACADGYTCVRMLIVGGTNRG